MRWRSTLREGVMGDGGVRAGQLLCRLLALGPAPAVVHPWIIVNRLVVTSASSFAPTLWT